MEAEFFTQDGFTDKLVSHGFFTRRGGVSAGLYESLNVGVGSDDARDNVIENRARVALAMGAEPENLLTVYQEHGAGCLSVSAAHDVFKPPKADAMVTDRVGLAIGVLSADCTPVLFYGQKGDGSPVVGAAHAGWKGALGGILGSTVAAMETLGAAKSGIKRCIGPCIGKASYEVSADFVEPFMDENPENEQFFSAGQREGHPYFDIAGYCALKLYKAGLKTVLMMDMDTYRREEEFFSYRRTTHREEKDYGRQISAIMIK